MVNYSTPSTSLSSSRTQVMDFRANTDVIMSTRQAPSMPSSKKVSHLTSCGTTISPIASRQQQSHIPTVSSKMTNNNVNTPSLSYSSHNFSIKSSPSSATVIKTSPSKPPPSHHIEGLLYNSPSYNSSTTPKSSFQYSSAKTQPSQAPYTVDYSTRKPSGWCNSVIVMTLHDYISQAYKYLLLPG